jgi:hypothetical protein
MVSEWMENGNIVEFVGRDRHVNRTELVRRPSIPTPTNPYLCALQLVDVANGLAYMHGLRMVHGDLKGVRVSLKLCVSTLTSRPFEGEYPN